ncbi:MAG: cell wall metabolism sensor histidine kinase WalK [Oscillospiraceae bacterium]|jgi:signal transduction histidine kinase|nr:cell wall metabolism sensor histidine kinase WalK [Oscillospiraceae bacterium]
MSFISKIKELAKKSAKLNSSLRTKYVIILWITAVAILTAVTFAVTLNVRTYYRSYFARITAEVFTDTDIQAALSACLSAENPPELMYDVLIAYSGKLGVDGERRTFFILDENGAIVLSNAKDGNLVGKYDFQRRVIGPYTILLRDDRTLAGEMSESITSITVKSGLVVISVASVLIFGIAHAVTAPIEEMTRTAIKIAKGDYSDKVKVRSRDEIGRLGRAFNYMAKQLRRTIERLERSEEAQRVLIADVSHELKTPLTSVTAYTETMLTSEVPPEAQLEFLRITLSEARRMTRIIGRLLELSRFDSGKVSLDVSYIDINEVCEKAVSAIKIQLQKKEQRLTLSCGEIPKIKGDAERILQVVLNLLSNASKYTPQGGKILLTTNYRADIKHVQLSVRDNGEGISEVDLPHVFERFYRADKARTSENASTGLGLSVTKEIVTLHGGDISAVSKHGKGSLFTVSLPVGEK